jgi:cytochrome c oxidase subunit IV
MSATIEHVDEPDAVAHHHSHDEHIPKDSYFIKVAIVLAVFTALETSTYWIDFGAFSTPLLITLMTIKFFMIVLIFMHLKFDNRLFGVMFYIGLGLALFVYGVMLFTFQFFRS